MMEWVLESADAASRMVSALSHEGGERPKVEVEGQERQWKLVDM